MRRRPKMKPKAAKRKGYAIYAGNVAQVSPRELQVTENRKRLLDKAPTKSQRKRRRKAYLNLLKKYRKEGAVLISPKAVPEGKFDKVIASMLKESSVVLTPSEFLKSFQVYLTPRQLQLLSAHSGYTVQELMAMAGVAEIGHGGDTRGNPKAPASIQLLKSIIHQYLVDNGNDELQYVERV